MADEIAQVCQLEIQGMTFVVKGTVQTAAFLGKALKALILWSMKKHFERPGERQVKDIFKMSEGGPAQVSDIPNKYLEEVFKVMGEHGLHHAIVVDNDVTDGKTPIMIPYQEAALVSTIVKNVILKHRTEQTDRLAEVNKAIAENNEKLVHLPPEAKSQIKEIETMLENLKQCKDEIHQVIDRDDDIIQNGSTVSFTEYLASFKDTDFEKNPDMAISELNQGVEIGKSFSAKECMQPIRNPELVPETNCYYYLPERGVSVTREFKTDEETKLVYSDYSLKSKTGEMYEFSDKNKTKSEWNEKDLPDLLGKADILEGTMCRVFTQEERMLTYAKLHGNVKSEAEIRVEERQKAGMEVFSSADAQKEIEHAVSERKKGIASAKLDNDTVEITVVGPNLIMEKGKLKMSIDENTFALFSDVVPGKVKDGTISFSVKKSDVVEVGTKDSRTENIHMAKFSAEGLKKQLDEKNNSPVHDLAKGIGR